MQKSTLVALAIALTSRLSLADNSDTLPTLNYPTQGQQLYATAVAEIGRAHV